MPHRPRALNVALVTALMLVSVLASAALTAPAARGGLNTLRWYPFGPVSSDPTFDRFKPEVLADQDGHILVFYYTTDTNSYFTNINVSRYTTGGGIFGLPVFLDDVQVNDPSSQGLVNTASPMSAAQDAAGNLYLAWTRQPSSGGLEVYVSKSVDGGESWGTAVPVNVAAPLKDDLWPSIAVTPAGTVYVAWSQLWSGTFANITVARSVDGGATFTGVMNVSLDGPGGSGEIGSMGIDSHGRVYIAYVGIGALFPNYVINVTWSDDGSTWATPTQLSPYNNMALYPSLLVDRFDRVHVAWLDYRGMLTVGTPQMWYTRSDTRGATWTGGTPVSQGGAYPTGLPRFALHRDTLMVLWAGTQSGNAMLSSAASTNGGEDWLPETDYATGTTEQYPAVAADENGTFYAPTTQSLLGTYDVAMYILNGPPSTPGDVTVTRTGTGNLTVSWTASPEQDTASYRVRMSTDGVTYTTVGTVAAPVTSLHVTGLANGTYWFEISAADILGTSSPDSMPASGTVGPTDAELIAALQAQIAGLNAQISGLYAQITALEDQLAQMNASTASDLANLEAQISGLQNQVTALQQQLTTLQAELATLQGSETADTAALQAELNRLQQNLSALEGRLEQIKADAAAQGSASQNMSLANLGFEAVALALLAALLVLQIRKPKRPQPEARSGRPEGAPQKPEDEL